MGVYDRRRSLGSLSSVILGATVTMYFLIKWQKFAHNKDPEKLKIHPIIQICHCYIINTCLDISIND